MIYIDKIYGKQEITDPIILKLMKTKEMVRLKGVNQYGSWAYLDPTFNTSRFEHCVGTYLILRQFGASKEEQIAGLIHDIGHSAFSHVFDYVFDRHETHDWHEGFHKEMVKKSEIAKILRENSFDVDFIANEENFQLLERDMPDLCADRVDYLLRDAFTSKKQNIEQVKFMFKSFFVLNNEIIMKSFDAAKQAAEVYLDMASTMYACDMQTGSYRVLADAIKIAIDKKIIAEKDFFTTDNELFNKLKDSDDKDILSKLKLLDKDLIGKGTSSDHDFFVTSKVRFIDPKFIHNGNVVRLSEHDPKFKKNLEEHKKNIEKGFYVKISQSKRSS